MDRFLTACAEGGDWQEIVSLCLAKLGPIPPQANLGFLYVTDALAGQLGHIADRLRRTTDVDDWVGTVGLGICCDDHEYYDAPAAAVMVGTFPPDSYRVFTTLQRDLGNLRVHQEWLDDSQFHPAVVHGDPRAAATPQLIELLAEGIPGIYLVGGLSSSQSTFPQLANHLCEGGLSGVVFSSAVPVVTTLTQGCSPIGPVHRVTEARQNVVATLDDRPALEVFKEEIGEVLARDLGRAAGYIFVGRPVEGSDTGDYMVRNLLGIDPGSGQLVIGDSITTGGPLMFCRRDGASAWEDLDRALGSIKRRANAPILGALYISCLGRGRYLFGDNSEELQRVQQALGEVPLVGFFANGEIAHDKLYGYTGVLTLFLQPNA